MAIAIEPSRTSKRIVRVVAGDELPDRLPAWRDYASRRGMNSLNDDPEWLVVLAEGRGDRPYCLEATSDGRLSGILPLALVSGPLFGRFLVGLSHLSTGGVCCDDRATGTALIDQAIVLADELDVNYLELRHKTPIQHAALRMAVTDKVLMRIDLPETGEQLFDQLGGKVRNQIRKAERFAFSETWGGRELLDEFYFLYARRMRQLGTPVDGREVFARTLAHFPRRAEVAVVRCGEQAVAAALVLHGHGISAMHRSAMHSDARSTGVNTWLHWRALLRAQRAGHRTFDLGCATVGSSVHTFKKRLGARSQPLAVQHYVRRGSPKRFRRRRQMTEVWIRLWRHLPESVTRWMGPRIARGIP